MSHPVQLPHESGSPVYIDPTDVTHIVPSDTKPESLTYVHLTHTANNSRILHVAATSRFVAARLFPEDVKPLSWRASFRIASWLRAMCAATFLLLLLPRALMAENADDYYAMSIISILEMNPAQPSHWHSHVKVSGFVEYIHREKDGDIHIRVSDVTGREMVAECVPEVPFCATLNVHKGDTVIVRGLLYYDYKHASTQGGWEIHPITSITEVKTK